MSDSPSLDDVRAQIDALDEQIQAAITERAKLALAVAQAKMAAGERGNFYRPEREAEVLRNVKGRNNGPLSDEQIGGIFQSIMSASLALQKPLSIAFLGPAGTFTQQAVVKKFGQSVNSVPLPGIAEVFRAVAAGECDYGVVPVENSTEGVVSHTLDMFLSSPLNICGEISLPIHHCLLSNVAAPGDIKQVYSHPQSFAQCRQWLDTHLPGVAQITVSSNAEAARLAAAEPGTAAIAGEVAAAIYALDVRHENIEDEPSNTTRFLVIGEREIARTGDDRTSLLLSTSNRPGALHDLLNPFAKHGVCLSRIESRPSGRARWDYVFFVDIDGHVNDENVAAALAEVQADVPMCRLLGAYPKEV